MRWLVPVALLVAGATGARADDFSGRATAGYSQVRSEQQHTDSFAQIYDLRFERAVSLALTYRLALRAQDDLGTALIDGARLRHENRELRPLVQLHWNRPALSLQLGYDLTWSQSITEDRESPSRLLQHASLATIASPSTDFRLTSDLQWRVERLGEEVDTSEVRGSLLAAGKMRTVTLSGGGTASHYTDPLKDFSRLGLGLISAVTWSDTFEGGKGMVSAGNTANWNLQRETSRSGMTVDEARRELPTAALHAIDNTPADSRDFPLTPVPALLDGDFATATAIDLGPLGVDHQALGIDLGRFVVVDELRVHVRSEAGNVVPRGGDIFFEVWTSIDTRDWQRHEGTPTVGFVLASSSYAVRFPAVSTRYVKLVTFGVNSLDTRVTELEVYSHATFTPEEDRTSQTFVDTVQFSFTGSPVERLVLSYNGLFNFSLLGSDRGEDFTGFDWAQSGTLSLRMARWLEALLGADNRRATRSGELTGSWTALSAQLTATPAATVTASLRGTIGLNLEATGSNDSKEARFALYTRILPSLDSSLDLGVGRQHWDPPLARTVDRTFVSWIGNAQLFRPLRLSGNVAMQRAVTSVDSMATSTEEKDYRAYGELSWRASQMLLLAARLGWAEGTTTSGLLQRYRLDWHPFPGGALILGFSFDQDQQNATGYRSRRVAIFPSLTLNRHMTLNLNFTRVELEGPEGTRENELFYVLLTIGT